MKEYTVKVYNDRTEWFLNGKFHREDGPAVECPDGFKSWWLNDKRHREYGPAIEWPNGDKEWYLNGRCHREDGPAIDWSNGDKQWYLNGKHLTEDEFNAKMNPIELTLDEIASKFNIPVQQLKIKK